MADVSFQSSQRQWLQDMASGNTGSGKIDRGPFETVTSKVGRQAPPKQRGGGSKVPPVGEAFARKKG